MDFCSKKCYYKNTLWGTMSDHLTTISGMQKQRRPAALAEPPVCILPSIFRGSKLRRDEAGNLHWESRRTRQRAILKVIHTNGAPWPAWQPRLHLDD